MNEPRPIRESIERLLHHLGGPGVDDTRTLVEKWPEIVGPELASRVEAVAVREHELVVHVHDPAWASQITWLEQQLLERIANELGSGSITAVRARLVSR